MIKMPTKTFVIKISASEEEIRDITEERFEGAIEDGLGEMGRFVFKIESVKEIKND